MNVICIFLRVHHSRTPVNTTAPVQWDAKQNVQRLFLWELYRGLRHGLWEHRQWN